MEGLIFGILRYFINGVFILLLFSSGKEDETRQNPSGPDSKAFSNSANKLIVGRTFATLCTLTFIRTMLCS